MWTVLTGEPKPQIAQDIHSGAASKESQVIWYFVKYIWEWHATGLADGWRSIDHVNNKQLTTDMTTNECAGQKCFHQNLLLAEKSRYWCTYSKRGLESRRKINAFHKTLYVFKMKNNFKIPTLQKVVTQYKFLSLVWGFFECIHIHSSSLCKSLIAEYQERLWPAIKLLSVLALTDTYMNGLCTRSIVQQFYCIFFFFQCLASFFFRNSGPCLHKCCIAIALCVQFLV